MSSKLSVRRATMLPHPITVASTCEPPPPPPAWPPATFDITLAYTCIPMMGPCFGGWTIATVRIIPTWTWTGTGPPPEGATSSWILSEIPSTADLELTGTNDQWGFYFLQKTMIPVNWNTPTDYVISSWDWIEWWILSATASFRF